MTKIKPYLSRLFALILVAVIGLVGCSSTTGLTGNYTQDTLAVIESIQEAIELPNDAPDRPAIESQIRNQINEYAGRYRRNDKVSGLRSFSTMLTAVNNLAGYYSSYPNRPLPEKLKQRLRKEIQQVELALKRGS